MESLKKHGHVHQFFNSPDKERRPGPGLRHGLANLGPAQALTLLVPSLDLSNHVIPRIKVIRVSASINQRRPSHVNILQLGARMFCSET